MSYIEDRDKLIPKAEREAINFVCRMKKRGKIQTIKDENEIFDRVFHQTMTELVKEAGI